MTPRAAPGSGLPGLTDEQLMIQVAHGNVDAFAVLYDRFSGRAYALARSLCSDRSWAEDAVQEAFVSIWNSRATYDPKGGRAAAWLFAVVRHRSIDVARRHERHDRHRAGEDALHAHTAPDDVAGQTLAQSEALRLQRSLALPEAQREVIALAFYGQLSHTEIAKHLGLPPGTLKGRMRSGLIRLRGDVDGAIV